MQAGQWWCQRHQQNNFRRGVVSALAFACVGRRALRVWMEEMKRSSRSNLFKRHVAQKIHIAVVAAQLNDVWAFWLNAIDRSRAQMLLANVQTCQLQRFLNCLFAMWELEAVVQHKGRTLEVRLESRSFTILKKSAANARQARHSAAAIAVLRIQVKILLVSSMHLCCSL